jgi:hypothetical protein
MSVKFLKEGGGIAELVAHLPMVPRSEVRIMTPTNVSLEHCFLEFMTDEKYQIIRLFHIKAYIDEVVQSSVF